MARSTGSGPADAGWRFVSFDVHRLAAGERVARAGDGQEVLVLVLEGTASVSVGGVAMGAVGTRADRVRRAAGRRRPVRAGRGRRGRRRGPVLLGIAAAPAGDVQRTAVVAPETILVETRGEGSSERTIKNLLPPSAEAGRLIAVEAYTPGGNWSSYPPHKHDTDDPPNESPARGAVLLPLRAADGLRHPARLHRGPVAGRDDDARPTRT